MLSNYTPDEYNLTTGAAALPLTLAEVKAQLYLTVSDTSQDDYLTLLINAVTSFAEKYTSRDLINKTYTTYLNCFPDFYLSPPIGIELRKSKLQSITSISYYIDNVLTVWSSSKYYATVQNDFSSVYLVNGESWPSVDVRAQAVKIIFVAGYGAAGSSVPADFKLALLQHIGQLFENRGDCPDAHLPENAKIIYDQYRIRTFSTFQNSSGIGYGLRIR